MNCNMKRLFTSDIEAVSKCIGTNERNERVILPSNLYGRITRISHSACGENGTLLSAFEQRRLPEDVEDRLKRQQGHPVFRSDDGGKTWSLSARIINEEHPDLLTYFIPTIYELPRDVGAFPRGTLLMAAFRAVRKMVLIYSCMSVRTPGAPGKCLGPWIMAVG